MDDKKHHRRRIVFFGHFGAGNFGNEGTLEAMLWNVRRMVPAAEVLCVATYPEQVVADYGIPGMRVSEALVKPWNVRNPLSRLARKLFVGVPSELYRWLRAIATLWHARLFMVVGTGLLNDAFSLGGWGPYSVFKWTVSAKICRCKILFVSAGAGPLDRPIARFFVKAALSLADFRSYRDETTLSYLKSIGFRAAGDRVYPDLAFSLPSEALLQPPVCYGRHPVAGLGLMALNGMYGNDKPTNQQYSVYLENLVGFAKWLLDRDYNIRLLIGDISDEPAVREIKSLLKSHAVPQDRVIDEPITSTGELLRQLAGTDFVVATRFHNVLFSLLLNKPTISISFHHKCSSLMRQMGMAEYTQDINALNCETLIQQFCRLQQNQGLIRQMLEGKVAGCREALDEQYSTILRTIWPGEDRIAQAATEIEHQPKTRALS
jgi:polysaccharide pyruvyl transferase WcaK-like protein